GVLASVVIAMAATFLSGRYGGPVMLFALLLGMPFHFLSLEGRCVAGINIAARMILRIGVGFLGARITISQIVSLGWKPFLSVICATLLTILVGAGIARAFKLQRDFGLLTGGATAICGASAALAIGTVLPRDRTSERDIIFAVIGVTTLSTLAMILYPLVAAVFHLSYVDQGVFLGGTIHDVAQVVGAGYSVSQQTGDVATVVKLLRVSMLLPVVLGLSLFLPGAARPAGTQALPVPGFLLGFAALVVLGSLGVIPAVVRDGLASISQWCLVIAIAALGMKTSIKALVQVGLRPIVLMVAETLFLAIFVLLVIEFLF
ncbi:MAG TPA: putative sulfate exporter family transporter, partial [Alphaproteobacteria bacterium]|nr:putative sulfate exporter family transporter [Alphaproteobacteria bacterium]